MEGFTISDKQQPSRLKTAHKHLPVKIAGGLLAVLLIAYLSVCGVAAVGSDKILPRTNVAGVELGGLRLSEVESALQAAQEAWSTKDDQHLVFAVEDGAGQSLTVHVPANYMVLDGKASTERVWEEERNHENFFLSGARYLRALTKDTTVAPVYVDSGNLDMLLAEDLDGRIGNAVEESTATLESGNLVITRGVSGFEPNKETIKEQLFSLLAEGKTVPATTEEPQFTIAMEETKPAELDFNAIHDELCVDAQDASVNEATGEFKMEVVGVSFDPAAAKTAYDALGAGESTKLALTVTQPKVKMKDLEQYLFKDLLGACTSKIGGTNNRLSNVKLAASYCTEVMMAPGEEFSYNGTVGRRTTARGFKPAPAYVGGQTVDEVGGGICQVSSTLYLAVLRANMGIVERHNHGYAVGYVPDGLDATVYSGSLDFRFQNTSKYPIKVVATVSDRTLSISIYGTSDGTSVEMTTEKISSKDYTTVYKVDSSLAAGKTKTSVTPYTGRTIKAYRNVYQNGQLVSNNLESTSVYKSRDKVVLVSPADAYKYGLGEAPAPVTPTPTPTPEATPESGAQT